MKSVIATFFAFSASLVVAFIIFQPTNIFFLMPSYDSAYASDLDGNKDKVFIYIVDSGVDPTVEGLDSFTAKGYNALKDKQGGNEDCTGHGSSVAHVIAGLSDSKKVTVVPVKTSECEEFNDPVSIVRGINWIIANHPEEAPVGIINLSFGYVDNIPFLDGLQNAVQSALDAGFVVVASAGNDSLTAGVDDADSTVVFDACMAVPANVPDVITVGSAMKSGTSKVVRSGFSNSGSCVDVFAPGQNVSIVERTDNGDWGWANSNGTSYSAPYVAAIIANKLAVERNLDRFQLEEYVKSKAAQGVIRNTKKSPFEPSTPVYPEHSTPNLFIKLEMNDFGGKEFYNPDKNR